MHGRLHNHQRLVDGLDAFAILAGYIETMNALLPDGTRPDVLRCNAARRRVFIGDAKHSESPRSQSTRSRLDHYMSWAADLVHGGRCEVTFAIMTHHSDEWLRVLVELAHERQLRGLALHGSLAAFEEVAAIVMGRELG